MKKYVLFDLDGTIIDSYPGIAAHLRRAMTHFGVEEIEDETLRRFIGPPLRKQFQEIFGLTAQQAEDATQLYREGYTKGEQAGMYEAFLYPYIEEFLMHLKDKGWKVALASSKNESACVKILEHFGILQYFDTVGGATDDGRLSEKAEVIELVLQRFGISHREEAVLIGDTKYDAWGARDASIDCIGVSYGFGGRQELEEALAAPVFDTLQEVEVYLFGQES